MEILESKTVVPFTPEEFTEKAQEIVDLCQGDATLLTGWGHRAMDSLMEDVLWSLGFNKRIEIFDQLRRVRY